MLDGRQSNAALSWLRRGIGISMAMPGPKSSVSLTMVHGERRGSGWKTHTGNVVWYSPENRDGLRYEGDGYGDNGGEHDRGELKEDEDEHEMRVLWTRTRTMKTERSRGVVLAGPGPTTVLESWKTLCE
jgi:hypothetical protein